MKIKEFFEGHLEYRAKMKNEKKTLAEVSRFLGNSIYRAVGEKEVDDLRLIDTADVIDQGKEHGIHGSQRSVCYYKQLLEYIHKLGIKLPFDYHDIEIPKVPDSRVQYLTTEELEQVRSCFDVNTSAGLRTRTLIEFLLDTGLRVGEAIALNRKDVNLERREIQVLNIKTKEWGSVYMTDRSIEWLKLYLSTRKDDNPALFISGRSRLLAVSSRNHIRTQTKHLNFTKKIGHHIFRRTLGTTLMQEKVDIKTVQEILRHKSERTTLKYYIGTNRERSRALHQEVTTRVFGKSLKSVGSSDSMSSYEGKFRAQQGVSAKATREPSEMELRRAWEFLQNSQDNSRGDIQKGLESVRNESADKILQQVHVEADGSTRYA